MMRSFEHMSLEQFAADRDARITAAIDELAPVVRDALILYPESGWEQEIIEGAAVLFTEMFEATGTGAPPTDDDYDEFGQELTSTLSQTGQPDDPPSDAQVDRLATWLAVYTVNAATQYASGEGTIMTWTTMRDDLVRDTHRAVDGQSRAVGDTFDVGGYPLSYPGQPVGPPAIWMGCRCLLVPGTSQGGVMAAPTSTATPTHAPTPKDVFAPEDVEPQGAPELEGAQLDEMPWHGVLAPEGVPTGDGRAFARESLRFRDLPLPLRYLPADFGEHDGAVVVGNITKIWRDGDLMKAEGTFIPGNDYALEAVEQLAGGYIRGVSVDLDDASMELTEDEDGREVATLTDGRISAATLVPIPAFAEAYVALGDWDLAEQVEALAADGCLPCMERAAREAARAELAAEQVSDKAWSDFTQADYDDDQWYRATVLHTNGDSRAKGDNKLPIREPDGTLNRNAVHAAASRFNQVDAPAEAKSAAAAALRGAYDALEEEPPEVLTAALVFAVEVGDAVSWETVDGDGEVEAHTGVVESVSDDGETATVRDGDDTYQVPVADLVVETDGGGESEDNPFNPDQMAADMAAFAPGTKDGPGWITNPQDTQRLRNYWVRGEGAAKIRWGQPGDFNRCRAQLAKYITNPQWLAGTCANLHKVALGVWPGQEGGENTAVRAQPFTIVASAGAPDADEPAGATYTPAPVEWFDDPDLAGPTPLQVTDDGRVFGHLATWGTCHIGIAGTCTTAPKSRSGYAYFTTGTYSAQAGPGEKVQIPVGALTLGTGHAKLDASAMATVEHYDNTGSVVAYVAAGEDDHGIWVAGTLAPNTPVEKRVALQAATLSGDWRKVAGNLELVAALAVNVPGFPIPRTRTHSTERGQVALAAAGVVQVAPEDDAVVAAGAGDLTATVTSAVIAALDARDAQRRRLRAARRAITAATDELDARRTEKVVAARDRLKAALGVSAS